MTASLKDMIDIYGFEHHRSIFDIWLMGYLFGVYCHRHDKSKLINHHKHPV